MTSTIKGITCAKNIKPEPSSIDQEKPAITFNRVCPAIILANKRTERLIGRKIYETNSIGTNKKAKPSYEPGGKNKEKTWKPCSRTHIMFIPIKVVNAKLKVNTKCDVIVNEYGTRPITFAIRTNKKTLKIKGKYFCPRLPTLSTSIPNTVS